MAAGISKATEVLIDLALEEDLGKQGDVTSAAFIDANSIASGCINSRELCVVAGSDICSYIFTRVDPAIVVELVLAPGDTARAGDTVMTIAGPACSILTAERTALNFLQRLSGIATMTKSFVDVVSGTGVKILDTRKTTPGWRELEKAAVRNGGGYNHRMGLYDMVMVKDNHLLAAGSLEETQTAIDSIKANYPDMRIEIEADNLEQVARFIELRGVDVILLGGSTAEWSSLTADERLSLLVAWRRALDDIDYTKTRGEARLSAATKPTILFHSGDVSVAKVTWPRVNHVALSTSLAEQSSHPHATHSGNIENAWVCYEAAN